MDKGRYENILAAALPAAVFVILTVLNLLLPKPEVLASERRRPSALPKLTAQALFNGEFAEGFEAWAADTFPFRDSLRSLRAHTVFNVYMQTDKSGLYYDDAVGAGEFKSHDAKRLLQSAEKLRSITESLPESKIYMALIPDKTVYAARSYPGTDYEAVRGLFEDALPEITHIDISGMLDAKSWYRTDLHWDQAEITGVASALARAMGAEIENEFTLNSAGEFLGVYSGQLALPLEPDTGRYLTSDAITNASVSYINPATLMWERGGMYMPEALSGRDPYDLFLGGAQPLVRIENPGAATLRELYIFRDSFGSSLAPLLTSGYRAITLIDLRYINARLLRQVFTIETDSDVLFLYSADILATPEILLT